MGGFDLDKTVDYWRWGARYDLGVASALLKARKYPYALFMGHLALEKLLKALVVKRTQNHAPFTHSLLTLPKRRGSNFRPDIGIYSAKSWSFISRVDILTTPPASTRSARRGTLLLT